MDWSVRVEARTGGFHLDAGIEGDAAPVAVIGPNGSGKTTLLRVIAGACRADRGRIRVGDRVLFDSRAGVFLAPEDRRVGYVPQGYGLFPHLTVLDNVAFGLAAGPARAPRADRHRIAADILGEIDCGHLARRYPAMLSGGEKQRVALARALLPAPEMLLLDEPLAAMDVAARRGLRSYLASHLARRRQPAIVVTHDPRDVHALSPPAVYALERGKVVQSGPPYRLAAEPATDFVAEFFA
ncbi:MAG: ATP-binding cassette domain-containing protein [Gemmatimonadetes bacterium]|nr:ATP-binding cassette domain-containing protein [Gemmatimonadota bacterium]MYG22464.1 ATP-binding cassette domain-containing protein [Gemmatimonadota bacterium]MYJ39562.1 ATP-binding cassette domain-containing protein [Gemmatimonadota bacterium]